MSKRKRELQKQKDPYENLFAFLIITPIFLLFIGYGIYGRYYESHYSLSELKCVNGVVVNAETWDNNNIRSSKSNRSSGVKLFFRGEEEPYLAATAGITEAKQIVAKFFKSEKPVKLYCRYRYQQLIGMGPFRLVYHLEVDSYPVINLNDKLQSASLAMKIITIGWFILFLLWLGYLIFYFKSYKKRNIIINR